MQEDRTRLVDPTISVCPPVPFTSWTRPVYLTAVPSSSTLKYIFNVVMAGSRGSIGWDQSGDNLILYLQIDKLDHFTHHELEEGSEVWIVFHMKE